MPSHDEFGTDLKDVSLSLAGGEIIGLAGIAGNGQSELMNALSGEILAGRPETILIDGMPAGHLGPNERRRLGGRFVPEERNGHGAVTTMTLAENAFLSGFMHVKLVRLGIIREQRTQAFARDIIHRFDVRTTGPNAKAKSLSGGNLQKFLVGREVLQNPSVLVINQPTWGVDVGACAGDPRGGAGPGARGGRRHHHLAGSRRAVRPGRPDRRHRRRPRLRPGAHPRRHHRGHRPLDGRRAAAGHGPCLNSSRAARSRASWRYLSPLLALLLTCLFSGLLFALMGKQPLRTIYTFLVLPLLQPDGIDYLLIKAAPLIMIAVGLALAYRAAIWNIGTEGQFTLGAIAAGGLALALPEAPGWLILPAMIVAGIVGGMAAAGLVAWLRIRFNANEILTSLMLTYIIQYLLLYLVTGPWRDPMGFGFPQTAMFSDAAAGPRLIEDSNLHLGIVVAPVAAVALWVMLQKSVLGYQFRVLGQAPRRPAVRRLR